MLITRDENEVWDVLNECTKQIDEGGSRFAGMSYEEGVLSAIRWLIGDTDEHPYPER